MVQTRGPGNATQPLLGKGLSHSGLLVFKGLLGTDVLEEGRVGQSDIPLPFPPLLFATQFLSNIAHKSLLTTCHCFQCCMCLLGGECGHFVSRERALSSGPGHLPHRMPLMVIKPSFSTWFQGARQQKDKHQREKWPQGRHC